MDIVVYGRSVPKCSYCENLLDLLNSKGISYIYKDIADEDIFEEYLKFKLKTVPSVFIDKEYKGGFTEVKELFKEVSSD